jgi:hypothetical protein
MKTPRPATLLPSALLAATTVLLLSLAPAMAQYVVDSPEQRLADLQRQEARLLQARAELLRLLDDDSVLFVDRPMRPGSGRAEEELYGIGFLRIPLPTVRADVRDYLALGLLTGVVGGANPLDLDWLDARTEQLWSDWQAEDQRIRDYLSVTIGRAIELRLAGVRSAAEELLSTRERPSMRATGWRLLQVVDGLQSESKPGLFGGRMVAVEDVQADESGGTARIRVALTSDCTETYLARWSFGTAVEWLSDDAGIEVDLDLELTGRRCPSDLYAAELEARGSLGTRPLAFVTLPRPAMQATTTGSLTSAQIGGAWQGPTHGSATIGVAVDVLRPGSFDSAYFFIDIMARSNLSTGGSVHYRVAYVYGPG